MASIHRRSEVIYDACGNYKKLNDNWDMVLENAMTLGRPRVARYQKT
jgi:hypothetical protein